HTTPGEHPPASGAPKQPAGTDKEEVGGSCNSCAGPHCSFWPSYLPPPRRPMPSARGCSGSKSPVREPTEVRHGQCRDGFKLVDHVCGYGGKAIPNRPPCTPMSVSPTPG